MMHPTKLEMLKVLADYYHVSVSVVASWLESCNEIEKRNERYSDHDL